MIADLVALAGAAGEASGRLMREALEGGVPHSGGKDEAARYFGEHYVAVSRVCAPVVIAIDGMIPGFSDWLNHTGFGDDKLMLLALMEMASSLAKYRRPSDARMRPDYIPPPQHL